MARRGIGSKFSCHCPAWGITKTSFSAIAPPRGLQRQVFSLLPRTRDNKSKFFCLCPAQGITKTCFLTYAPPRGLQRQVFLLLPRLGDCNDKFSCLCPAQAKNPGTETKKSVKPLAMSGFDRFLLFYYTFLISFFATQAPLSTKRTSVPKRISILFTSELSKTTPLPKYS